MLFHFDTDTSFKEYDLEIQMVQILPFLFPTAPPVHGPRVPEPVVSQRPECSGPTPPRDSPAPAEGPVVLVVPPVDQAQAPAAAVVTPAF